MNDDKVLTVDNRHTRNRMVADGIPLHDTEEAASISVDQWFDHWMALADDYESRGDAAIAAGHELSGGEWIWTGSLAAHYGQYIWWKEADRRQVGQQRKVDLYRKAAPYLSPPAERLEVTLGEIEIPAYLRVPQHGSGPFPCVVLIGGLESTKEESRLFEELCAARGMATVAFDGPGQGELFPEHGLQPGFNRFTSAVVDAIESRPEIDNDRLAVLGRSLGGYYAPLSAACDHRFKACVAWSACFDMSEFDQMTVELREGFVYVTGEQDEAEARKILDQSIDLGPVIEDLVCPTFISHGARDNIFTTAHVEKMRERAVNAELTIEVEPDGDHCCHQLAHIVRPRMADWIVDQLNR